MNIFGKCEQSLNLWYLKQTGMFSKIWISFWKYKHFIKIKHFKYWCSNFKNGTFFIISEQFQISVCFEICKHFRNFWTHFQHQEYFFEYMTKFETTNIFQILKQIFEKTTIFMKFQTIKFNYEYFWILWKKNWKMELFIKFWTKNWNREHI